MRNNPVLRSLPSVLSRRLQEAMTSRGYTVSQLSFASDIRKPTLMRMLSEDLARLPDTYTLIKLAHALDVSLEYLLGLGVQQMESALSFSGDFFPDPYAPENRLYEEMFHSQSNGYFIYVCETLPELLKTRPVLELELGNTAVAAAYHGRMEAMKAAAANRENNGLVLMDSRIIDNLLSGTGQYAGLTAPQIRDQIGSLKSFFEAHFPTVNACVVDYRKNGLTQMFLSTPCRVVTRMGDGYVMTGNHELYQHLRRTARSACDAGIPFSNYLAGKSHLAPVLRSGEKRTG